MPATPADAAPAAPNAIFRKTKMCKFNLAGRCMRSGACAFAHSAAELEQLPDFKFTRMCPALSKTGSCAQGAACTFAHKASELRAPRKGAARGAMANDAHLTHTTAPAPPPPPTETLISMQQVLVGMGVVLLQVLPPCKEQGTGNTADDGVSVADLDFATCDKLSGGWSRQTTEDIDFANNPSSSWSRQTTEEGLEGIDFANNPSSSWSRQTTEEGLEDLDYSATGVADLDFPTCDKPFGGWSRQTTEEGFEDPLGEFSRQSSEGSEEYVWGLEEEPENQSNARGVEESLMESFEGSDLAYVVKNTFLQFNDQETPLPMIRRALSTGSCAVRSS